jgi:nucleotide-binding universal stress UspA family protein
MPLKRSRGPRPAYRHLLVPTDGAPRSASARKAALEIARAFDARITAVHVIPPYSPAAVADAGAVGPPPATRDEYQRLAESRGRACLRKVVASARRVRVPVEVALVTSNAPGEAIADAARAHACDLVVMATSNRVGFERLMLGSVTAEVLARSSVPVLVVR